MLNNIISSLKGAGSIAILPHITADGDALGSCLAFALALKKLGKNVKVYLEEEIPYIYGFLPGKDLAEVYKGTFRNFDVAAALDTGDPSMLGERMDIFKG